ncbi:hypothetical protein Patl1_33518 [Pistacia atlantica]|uniref:Uncharacterized protein n=1 Tax=Pistacia atlantica TaxID=434234 RepID=A0ACC0ZPK8_9ROSI|nr:hypothetical protein Patl1_33518 [Pistacia atlantica]
MQVVASTSIHTGTHLSNQQARSPRHHRRRSYQETGGRYDYIIVGGGTAGCPLAATLSQNFSVLLLERGGVPFSNVNVSFLSNFHLALADTSPTSASQYFISTDGVLNSRARVLGGGSSINAGFYTRANAGFIKRVGWDEKLVNESYPWVEKQIVHQPTFAPWQRALRDSLLDVGVSPFNGFTYDHIYGTKVGGTIFDRFGRRHTSAELLASADPKKITVLIHATVQKILFDTSGKRPKAVGVLFKDENGKQHRAYVSNNPKSEVILSTGALGTPQMLMLSGVGPKAELEKFKIPIVLDNEFVGKGMADNPMNAPSSGYGQSKDSIHCHHGIMSAEIGQLSTIPPKQRTPEAVQDYIRRKRELPHEAFKGGFILEKIAKPMSTGELTLVNTNVDDNPSVSFNYFSHPDDLKSCVQGIRMAAKLVQSQHFLNYTKCDQQTVESILNASVKANVNLIPKHTNDTKSLEQLRVVDISTFNESPGTNPQGTILMMGRYMGVKILRDRLGKTAGV